VHIASSKQHTAYIGLDPAACEQAGLTQRYGEGRTGRYRGCEGGEQARTLAAAASGNALMRFSRRWHQWT
jgi:hypothetical protein